MESKMKQLIQFIKEGGFDFVDVIHIIDKAERLSKEEINQNIYLNRKINYLEQRCDALLKLNDELEKSLKAFYDGREQVQSCEAKKEQLKLQTFDEFTRDIRQTSMLDTEPFKQSFKVSFHD